MYMICRNDGHREMYFLELLIVRAGQVDGLFISTKTIEPAAGVIECVAGKMLVRFCSIIFFVLAPVASPCSRFGTTGKIDTHLSV